MPNSTDDNLGKRQPAANVIDDKTHPRHLTRHPVNEVLLDNSRKVNSNVSGDLKFYMGLQGGISSTPATINV
jgi:hypothetical protein